MEMEKTKRFLEEETTPSSPAEEYSTDVSTLKPAHFLEKNAKYFEEIRKRLKLKRQGEKLRKSGSLSSLRDSLEGILFFFFFFLFNTFSQIPFFFITKTEKRKEEKRGNSLTNLKTQSLLDVLEPTTSLPQDLQEKKQEERKTKKRKQDEGKI